MFYQKYPFTRLRRNRNSEFIRALTKENILTTKDLVYPIFIVDGKNKKIAIKEMPGQYRLSIDNLILLVKQCLKLGIVAIALFPVIENPDEKDILATNSYNPDALIQRACRTLKKHFPKLGIFTDIALDPYTISGHDGIVCDKTGIILNDVTNGILIKQALSHAEAGADYVCPSDMMDGRIGAIRNALENNSFHNTGIIAYSTKYASSFYAPFRKAINANSNLGKDGKLTYQISPSNSNEALHEASLDISEGADILMVKPGILYLDIISQLKTTFKKPIAVYNVSGEYSMFKAASKLKFLNYEDSILECMMAFKRAGASMIWTYSAIDVAKLLAQKGHIHY